MTKQMSEVLEFLRSFIAGGMNQDFKPWASELYGKLYRSTDEPTELQNSDMPCQECGALRKDGYIDHMDSCSVDTERTA